MAPSPVLSERCVLGAATQLVCRQRDPGTESVALPPLSAQFEWWKLVSESRRRHRSHCHCAALAERPLFARRSVVGLVPSTTGCPALGLLPRSASVMPEFMQSDFSLSKYSLACPNSLLALSKSAFAWERAADFADISLVLYCTSFRVKARVICDGCTNSLWVLACCSSVA